MTARLIAVFAALGLLLAPLTGAFADPAVLSQSAFTERFVEALRKADPDLRVVRKGPADLDIYSPGQKEPAQMYLGNAYRQYVNDPDALDDILSRFVRVTLTMASPPEMARGDMRLLIRPASYLTELARLQKEKGMDDMPFNQPLAGDLLIIMAQNTPDAFTFPPRSQVRKALGNDDEGLWKAAREQTLKAITNIRFETVADGLVLVSADDDLAASLLLDDAFWNRKELAGKGELVVAVIEKGTLLVGHVQNEGDVEFLQGFVSDQFAKGDSLSEVLLVRRGGQWVVRPPGFEADNSDVAPLRMAG